MPSLGERLRRERLKQGLDITEVASRTRISGRYIEAIENDDAASLPGKFFYRSFVRQYASTLGLDETAIDEEVRRILSQGESEPGPVAPAPPIEVPPIDAGAGRSNRLPGSLIVLIAVIVACAGLFGLWQRTRSPQVPVAPRAARPVPAAPVPAPPAISPSPPGETSEPVSESPAPEPPAAKAPEPPPAAEAEPPPRAPAPSPGPLGTGPLTVEVTAKEPVWVNISSDGRDLVTRVLQPGDSRVVRGSNEIKVLSGNAGGMTVTVNGKPLDEVGPPGQVRVITVTPAGAEVAAPRRQAPPREPQP